MIPLDLQAVLNHDSPRVRLAADAVAMSIRYLAGVMLQEAEKRLEAVRAEHDELVALCVLPRDAVQQQGLASVNLQDCRFGGYDYRGPSLVRFDEPVRVDIPAEAATAAAGGTVPVTMLRPGDDEPITVDVPVEEVPRTTAEWVEALTITPPPTPAQVALDEIRDRLRGRSAARAAEKARKVEERLEAAGAYACGECGERFPDQDAHDAHLEVHRDEPPDVVAEFVEAVTDPAIDAAPESAEEPPAVTEPEPRVCCGRTFTRAQAWSGHQRLAHGPKEKCGIRGCEAEYSNPGALERHRAGCGGVPGYEPPAAEVAPVEAPADAVGPLGFPVAHPMLDVCTCGHSRRVHPDGHCKLNACFCAAFASTRAV